MTNAPKKSPRLLIKTAERFLESREIPEPLATAEYLLAGLLDIQRPQLYLLDTISQQQERLFRRLLKRLAGKRLPLAYVLGSQNFLGLDFKVRARAVLIPRPETEGLVENAVSHIRKKFPQGSHLEIADMGTGSGCIIIGLWKALHQEYQLRLWGIDSSTKALKIAAQNAKAFGAAQKTIRWVKSNLFSRAGAKTKFDAIISNPPYIATKDWKRLPPHIRLWEPRQALDGGPDGLDIIRPLIAQSYQRLKPGGLFLLEFGSRQAARIAACLLKNGFRRPDILKDLSGRPRVAISWR